MWPPNGGAYLLKRTSRFGDEETRENNLVFATVVGPSAVKYTVLDSDDFKTVFGGGAQFEYDGSPASPNTRTRRCYATITRDKTTTQSAPHRPARIAIDERDFETTPGPNTIISVIIIVHFYDPNRRRRYCCRYY